MVSLRGLMFAIALLVSVPAAAEAPRPHGDGDVALQGQNYPKEEYIWLALAQQGDVESQFKLATLYDEGFLQVESPEVEAFRWYEKAAVQGHRVAAYNLGNAYKHGRGTVQSDSLASYWWQKAAENGIASAQFNLALQYLRGLGVTQDQEQAVLLINEAAQNGHPRARSLLDTGQIPTRESNLYPRQLAQAGADQSSPAMSAPTSQQQVEDKATPPASAEVRSEVSAEVSPDIDDLSWLASQSPQGYTIQLAVMASLENVRGFLREHNLLGRAHVVPLQVRGQRLNYIVMEDFDTRSACQAAINGLPAPLRKVKPWPRSLGELQSLTEG